MTTQGLFLCKCGHPDIAPALAYLTTWVQKPNCADGPSYVECCGVVS